MGDRVAAIVSAEPVTHEDAAAWDDFVSSHPGGTLYHTTAWRRVVERVFGHQTFYFAAYTGERGIAGVLPLVRLKSSLFGDFLVSLPFVNYGGALAADESADRALMHSACQLGARLGARHIEFREEMPRSGAWPCRSDKVIMELPLRTDSEALFRALSSKVRAQVRRPIKEGAHVAYGGRELLPEFYAVFARNMRDLGTPVYPQSLFSVICDTLPDAAKLIVVRIDRTPAAAGFLLRYRDRMEIPWASSIREYNRFGVNMLLYWEALKLASAEGCAVFDFGRSTAGSGTYRFKEQWGAVPKQLYWHYWLRSGDRAPELSPSNPRYHMAIRVWQRLPLAIANLLGPRIVKYLP